MRAVDPAAGAIPEAFRTPIGVPIIYQGVPVSAIGTTPKGAAVAAAVVATTSKATFQAFTKNHRPFGQKNHHQGRKVWYMLPQHHLLPLLPLQMMTNRQHRSRPQVDHDLPQPPHPPLKEVAAIMQNS